MRRVSGVPPGVLALLAALLLAACSSAPEPVAPASPPPPPPPADIRTGLVGKWKSITEFRYHQPDGDVITADLFLTFFPDGRFEIASQSRDGRRQDAVTKNDRSGTYRILDSSHLEITSKGKPETWEAAVKLVRKGGTVNFFGGCPAGSTVSLDTGLIHYSNLTLLASFHHTPRTIRRALELIETGVIRAADFVDGKCALSRLPELFKSMAAGNRVVKTFVDVRA